MFTYIYGNGEGCHQKPSLWNFALSQLHLFKEEEEEEEEEREK